MLSNNPDYCEYCKGPCQIPDPKPYCTTCKQPTKLIQKSSGFYDNGDTRFTYFYVCGAGHKSYNADYRFSS